MFNDIVPVVFDEYILNKDIVNKLKSYNKYNLQNLILHGYGKKTIVDSFILHLFNIKSLKKKLIIYNVKINNNDVKINVLQNNYYYEINLYEYALYDKHIVCGFIKELISTKNVHNIFYKIIILNYFDKISKPAQLSLRKLIESNFNNVRFIITTKSLDAIEQSLKSRCDLIRIPFPKKNLNEYLDFCENKLKKKINKNKVISKCNYSLFTLNTLIFNCDYIDPITIYVKQIHDILSKSKNILFIQDIRIIIYKLHLLNIDANKIFNIYIEYLCKEKIFSNEILHKIVRQASLNELQSTQMIKYFFCLERFFIFIKRHL